jgi:hypothetical protein
VSSAIGRNDGRSISEVWRGAGTGLIPASLAAFNPSPLGIIRLCSLIRTVPREERRMSYNLSFLYVRTVLQEQGPLTADEITGILTQFSPSTIARVLDWAVANRDLELVDDRYVLTDRGRR